MMSKELFEIKCRMSLKSNDCFSVENGYDWQEKTEIERVSGKFFDVCEVLKYVAVLVLLELCSIRKKFYTSVFNIAMVWSAFVVGSVVYSPFSFIPIIAFHLVDINIWLLLWWLEMKPL